MDTQFLSCLEHFQTAVFRTRDADLDTVYYTNANLHPNPNVGD
jgi:hypothetical protein